MENKIPKNSKLNLWPPEKEFSSLIKEEELTHITFRFNDFKLKSQIKLCMLIKKLSPIYTIKNIRDRKSVLGLWFSVGAVLFSITDWRQTKHLMHILPPLVISTLIFVSGRKLWMKTIFIIIFVFLLFNNITKFAVKQ